MLYFEGKQLPINDVKNVIKYRVYDGHKFIYYLGIHMEDYSVVNFKYDTKEERDEKKKYLESMLKEYFGPRD